MKVEQQVRNGLTPGYASRCQRASSLLPMTLDPLRETGTRAELIEKLREMAVGWHHLCKDALSAAAFDAAEGLEEGSFSVKVGHTIYTVVDDESAAE